MHVKVLVRCLEHRTLAHVLGAGVANRAERLERAAQTGMRGLVSLSALSSYLLCWEIVF